VGDAALRLFTRVVGEELRSVDLFGRMGGEEFCLVLPETDRAGGLALMDRIGASLRRRDMAVDGASIRITASFGLVQCTPEDMLDDLLREADAALYDAKRRGRDRAVAR
jgi:diguanylate cyclase (GGDEF)-like protein